MTVTVGAVCMAVMVFVGMLGCWRGVRTAFGIERRFDLDDARTKSAQHLFEYLITANAQRFCQNLCRHVAVAEVPGDAHKMMWIVAAYLKEKFRCGNDFHQSTVVKDQGIAISE
jgi:hypothetical protein